MPYKNKRGRIRQVALDKCATQYSPAPRSARGFRDGKVALSRGGAVVAFKGYCLESALQTPFDLKNRKTFKIKTRRRSRNRTSDSKNRVNRILGESLRLASHAHESTSRQPFPFAELTHLLQQRPRCPHTFELGVQTRVSLLKCRYTSPAQGRDSDSTKLSWLTSVFLLSVTSYLICNISLSLSLYLSLYIHMCMCIYIYIYIFTIC